MALLSLALAAEPDALLAQAREAQGQNDPAGERAACDAVMAQAPAGHAARERCAARLAYLQARQDADGGLSAYARFLALRSDAEALPQIRAMYDDPSLPSALHQDLALWLARSSGDPTPYLDGWTGADGAQAAARRQLLSEPRRGERRRRRDAGAQLALGSAALFAVVAAPGAWRARAQRPKPVGLALLGAVGLGSALIAGLWEFKAAQAILGATVLLVPVHLLSLYGLLGGGRTLPLRVLAGLAGLAVVYLVLWRMELLDRVGL